MRNAASEQCVYTSIRNCAACGVRDVGVTLKFVNNNQLNKVVRKIIIILPRASIIKYARYFVLRKSKLANGVDN